MSLYMCIDFLLHPQVESFHFMLFMGATGSLTSVSHDDNSSLARCYYVSGSSVL